MSCFGLNSSLKVNKEICFTVPPRFSLILPLTQPSFLKAGIHSSLLEQQGVLLCGFPFLLEKALGGEGLGEKQVLPLVLLRQEATNEGKYILIS